MRVFGCIFGLARTGHCAFGVNCVQVGAAIAVVVTVCAATAISSEIIHFFMGASSMNGAQVCVGRCGLCKCCVERVTYAKNRTQKNGPPGGDPNAWRLHS